MLTIAGASLARLIEDCCENFLIVDCRSFLAYNAEHINQAVNARSNSIMRRRSRGNFTLENVIMNAEKREEFLSGKIRTVVVYDQLGDLSSCDLNSTKSDVTAALTLKALRSSDPASADISYLKGGFATFEQEYPLCCRRSLVKNMSVPASADAAKCVELSATVPFYDQGNPVEILPHLYLGSAFHAKQIEKLKSLGITAVLNVSTASTRRLEANFRYERIHVEDNGNADISSRFENAISFINEEKRKGGKTLVHCHAGISRSPTICIAYLMTCNQMSLNAAFMYVKDRRTAISPNFNFMGQLLTLENTLKTNKDQPSRIAPITEELVDCVGEVKTCFIQSDERHVMRPCRDPSVAPLAKLCRRRTSDAVHLSMPASNEVLCSTGATRSCHTAPVMLRKFIFAAGNRTDSSRKHRTLSMVTLRSKSDLKIAS